MIENRDFEKLINQYDFEGAFFYCDPPYSKGCGYAVTSTADFDHERLRDTLKNIKGRFLLSYDDSPKIRELYKDFEMVDYKVGTHTLRKTFGYHHYQKFKDVAVLQKIFNHYSPQVTLRYIGIDQDMIDNSYNNFIL